MASTPAPRAPTPSTASPRAKGSLGVPVKERGILMSGPMVRATLRDMKGQTRRVIGSTAPPLPDRPLRLDPAMSTAYQAGDSWKCPFGVPGDRLYIRETFRPINLQGWAAWVYAADELPDQTDVQGPWKPAIHMPRTAARILLEVMDVRVQRVQEISEVDAIAEGSCIRHSFGENSHACDKALDRRQHAGRFDSRCCFARAWDELNGKRGFGWAANPWVWAISFRRLPPFIHAAGRHAGEPRAKHPEAYLES